MEDAQVTFPHPRESAAARPQSNLRTRISKAGSQERGLYFASEWDPSIRPCSNATIPARIRSPAASCILRYGKGVYIFTAYSWFRELPAGVPGAYRLFANMLSGGSRH